MDTRTTTCRSTLPAIAIALIVALTGCSATEKSATRADDTTASSKKSTDTEGSEDAEDTGVVSEEVETVAETEESEPEDTMFSLNETVTIGNWDVKVTDLALNANAAIAQANMFNEKPRGQFVMATFEATYNGSERMADIGSDLSWSLTSTDNTVNDDAYMVTPADNQSWPTETRKGGTVKGQATFDVKPGTIKGGILTVETMDEDWNTIYADFEIR